MASIAFIGLGTMGFPMAGHLANAGHTVSVWNRTGSKSQAWLNTYNGRIAQSPAAAAEQAEFVITCVGNDHDLSDVVLGPQGIAEGIQPGALLIDHSTVSADISRALATQLAERDIGFIDAPISGGQQGAINGQLSIFCGGHVEHIARAEPVLAAYGKAIAHVGPQGHGQLAKMVNQICVAGVLAGLSEGIFFAQQAGLDCERILPLIGQGAGSSWQLINRYKTMLNGQYDHGFAVDWMRKDLRIVLSEADAMQLDLASTRATLSAYDEISAEGGGRWDTSSLLKRLQKDR